MALDADTLSASSNDMIVSDVDYRIIGLSPQYWSYTPILIGDLNGLPLINGVDCFVVAPQAHNHVTHADTGGVDEELNLKDDGGAHCEEPMDVDNGDSLGDEDRNSKEQTPHSPNDNNFGDTPWHILPLSRVLFRGVATAIDRRPNGCTLIVLDDGTGSIDCRYWENSSGNSAFNLPALLLEHESSSNTHQRNGFQFVLGDSLEVMGKIKTLTAGTAVTGSDNNNCKLSKNNSSIPMEVRFGCVREVHATSVCRIKKERESREANQWNGEMVHWLKCIEFSRSLAGQKKSIATNDSAKHASSSSPCKRIRSGKAVLPLLGETITSSILGDGSSDLSTLNNILGNNSNVLTRKCCQTPNRFREALFYCHCEATLEALDPSLRYRDAVLNTLLDMESCLQQLSVSTSHQSATEDCMDLYDADAGLPPLLFTFESIYKDESLASIASEIVSSTDHPEANAQRLVRKTFAALVNDGILSLYDTAKDLYLFVSQTRVIEPFLRKSMGAGDGGGGFGLGPQIPQPFFVRSVPKKRIAEIRSWIGSNTVS